MARSAYASLRASGVLRGLDDDSETEDIEAIDDFESMGKQPLLTAFEDSSHDPCGFLSAEELKQRKRWPFSKSRKKGICPLCNDVVRSGAHECTQVARKLQEALQADIKRNEGNVHYRQGNYQSAVESYSAALHFTPDDSKLLSNRAAAFTLLGEHTKAILDCDGAISSAPTWPKGYFRKALVHETAGDLVAAIETYKHALRACRKPEDQNKIKRQLSSIRAQHTAQTLPKSYGDQALSAWWEDMRMKGAKYIREDDERERRLSRAEELKRKGNFEVSKQDWASAKGHYGQARELLFFCPTKPCCEQARLEVAVLLNAALCEAHLGKHEIVTVLCAEALALDPTNVKARFRRAAALGELRGYDDALEDIITAVHLQPDDSELLALHRKLKGKRALLLRKQQAQFSQIFADDRNRTSW